MKQLLLSLYCVLLLTSLIGCQPEDKRESFKREELFTLPIGVMEDEIFFFTSRRREAFLFPCEKNFSVDNGIVFIADGCGGRVQEFNSYGDFLSFIYNPKANVVDDSAIHGFRESVAWNFLNIGKFDISEKAIFVEDQVLEKEIIGSRVLRFNRQREFDYYLGRQGKNGDSFMQINSIKALSDGSLLVEEQLETETLYRYSEEGELLNTYTLFSSLFTLGDDDSTLIPEIDTIITNGEGETLILLVDYYSQSSENSVMTLSDTVGLFSYSLSDKSISFLTIFDKNPSGDDLESVMYSLVGFSDDGEVFLRREAERSELLILGRDNKLKTYSVAAIDEPIIWKRYAYSEPGMVYELVLYYDRAVIYLWQKVSN